RQSPWCTQPTPAKASGTSASASSAVSPSVTSSGSRGEVTVNPPSGCGERINGISLGIVSPGFLNDQPPGQFAFSTCPDGGGDGAQLYPRRSRLPQRNI